MVLSVTNQAFSVRERREKKRGRGGQQEGGCEKARQKMHLGTREWEQEQSLEGAEGGRRKLRCMHPTPTAQGGAGWLPPFGSFPALPIPGLGS